MTDTIDLKLYKNKRMGEFVSLPESMIKSTLDSLYLATYFKKLRSKSLSKIRSYKHYEKKMEDWVSKLEGVDTTNLALIANTLRINIEVLNPMTKVTSGSQIYTGVGSRKNTVQLLKVKPNVYKPVQMGGTFQAQAQVLPTNAWMKMGRKRKEYTSPKYKSRSRVTPKSPKKQSYSITGAFEYRTSDGNLLDFESIRNMIMSDSITPEMMLTYLLVGTSLCSKGVHIVQQAADHAAILSSSYATMTATPLLLTELDATSYSFIFGATVRINVEVLRQNIDTIEKEILKSYDILNYNSNRELFYLIETFETSSEMTRGGNVKTPMSYLKEIKKRTEKEVQSELSYISTDNRHRVPRRHIIKATMVGMGGEALHRVIKISVHQSYDKEYEVESQVYAEFKNNYTNFYNDNVLRFYGTGVLEGDYSVNFEDDDGNQKSTTIPCDEVYLRRKYLVTEFNPTLHTLYEYLREFVTLSPEDAKTQIFTGILIVLDALYHAHDKCKFTHGDFHSQNIFIDSETSRPILFDFDWASFNSVNEKVMHHFQNDYMNREFDNLYTFYMDGIRLVMSCAGGIPADFIESFQVTLDADSNHLETGLLYFMETIFDMIPRGHGIPEMVSYRKRWLSAMFNGSLGDETIRSLLNQQSHAFISAVANTQKRKEVHRGIQGTILMTP